MNSQDNPGPSGLRQDNPGPSGLQVSQDDSGPSGLQVSRSKSPPVKRKRGNRIFVELVTAGFPVLL